AEAGEQRHAASLRGCHTSGSPVADATEECGWNKDASGIPLYLVGDSNAEQFTEAVVGAGELLDRPVWVTTGSACPFVDGIEVLEPTDTDEFLPGSVAHTAYDHCPEYVAKTLEWLEASPPGVVFVASLDQYWWDSEMGAQAVGGHPEYAESAKLALMEEGLSSAVRRVEAAGHRVVLVQSIPTYRNPTPIWEPSACSIVTYALRGCHRTLPIDVVDGIQSPTRSAINRVAQQTRASVLDLRQEYCQAGECSTDRAGVSLYRDATHITVEE
ncbi:MAG: hypothetical protein RLZ55_1177, partial [Actinomycetota bacterium]